MKSSLQPKHADWHSWHGYRCLSGRTAPGDGWCTWLSADSPPAWLQVLDWDSDGRHQLIGTARQSVHALVAAAAAGSPFPLVNSIGKPGAGSLVFSDAVITETPSFLDLLKGGLQIDFSVAIDFTLSNGNVNNPQSLHHSAAGQLTQYEQAILGVGKILDHYNAKQCEPRCPRTPLGPSAGRACSVTVAATFRSAWWATWKSA